MSTAYSLSDALPKDSGAQQFIAWINSESSVNDFALPLGIGASETANSSKITARLGVGVHTQGSPVKALHPVMTQGAVFIESIGASPATSPVTSGRSQVITATNWGEIHSVPAPKTGSQLSTSANLVKNGSGIVYSAYVACSEIGHGDVFRLRDDTSDKITIIAGSAFGNQHAAIPDGGIVFSTNIKHTQTVSTGAASFILTFR